MRKKCLSLLLISAMTMSTMLTGCGGKEAKDENGPITMMAVINNNVSPQDTSAWKYFTPDDKYDFDVEAYNRDILKEKLNIKLSTNQCPDVFYKCGGAGGISPAEIAKYGKQGTFISLNKLIEEHMPNLSKVLEERPEVRKEITDEDGNIYALPSIGMKTSTTNAYFINKKWLDNLGLKTPSNPDELYKVLKEFKDKDANGNGDPNDEIPFMMSAKFPYSMTRGMMTLFGTKCATMSNVIDNNGKLEDIRVSDTYKEILEYSRKLYADGLIYENTFTETMAQVKAKASSADILGFTINIPNTATYVGPKYSAQYTYLDLSKQKNIAYLKTGVNVGTLIITDECANPEKVCEWADQFYSEEGYLRALLGEENVTYKWLDDNKTTYEWIVPEGSDLMTLKAKETLVGTFTMPGAINKVISSNDATEKIVNAAKQNYLKISEGYFPNLQYSDSDAKTVSSIEADIDSYVETYTAQVITGQTDLNSTWEDYKKQLENMGLSKELKIKQAAYDKAMKN